MMLKITKGLVALTVCIVLAPVIWIITTVTVVQGIVNDDE